MKKSLFDWMLRIAAAVILLQTLFFKFTASEESVYIFSTLGMEPFGRIASGVGELIASVLILIPRTTVYGALMGLGIIAGAIVSHLFVLGIAVKNDGGLLFILAVAVFLCCAILIYRDRVILQSILFKYKNRLA
ncbi:DoxX family membrane protein [Flavobacterium sp.]|uniref:DoxX family membrane protein n=1 Tax=Flavobacterium sp. TaxID=239 RepID=UPI0039E3EFF2